MSEYATSPVFQDDNGFRALTELAPDVVAVADVAGLISYVSPAVSRVMGYLPGEVIGRPFLELIHPDDQHTARDDWARVLGNDEIVSANLRFRHKDGSFRVLETMAKNYSGVPEVKGVLVTTRDITRRVAHEDELRSAFVEISDLYNNAPCGYHSLDADGIVVRINDTELGWLGRARDDVVGRMRFSEMLSAESLPIFERLFPLFKAQGRVDNVELELVRNDDTVLPVLLSATGDKGEDARFVMGRAILYDISERKLAEAALCKVNRALRTLNAVTSELIRADQEPALLQNICRVCVELGGYRMAWVGFALPDAAKTVTPVAAAGFEEGYLARANISWADDARGLGPTGESIRTGLVQVNRDFLSDPRMAPWRDDALRCGYRSSIALPIKDASGPFGALMIYASEPEAFDPAEVRLLEEVVGDLAFGILALRTREGHKRAEEAIEQLAFFDPLTGLPNRNKLLDALGQASERLRSGGPQFALISLNMMRFSDIQSGIGVREADELLVQLAARLQQALHEGEMLARTGSDDFAVLVLDDGAARARACGERIEQALAAPFRQAGISITVLARIGAATSSEDGVDPDVLLLHSGIAARQARKTGESFALYQGPTEEETPRYLSLVSELREAIEAKQLVLHYQPKIDLATGRIAGVEALLRWRHPGHGLIPTEEIISIAEQTGLIRPLTYSVLDAALHQCSIWKRQGFFASVAVNVSANNFDDPDFLRRTEEMLRSWNVEAGSLQLEITESVLMEEPAETLDLLVRLKRRGISVSIDDFGTGYSSLSYVASLPIEAVKIDRSFVSQMVDSARTRSVVAATIAMAQSLGIKTVAEGVESKGQAEMAMAMGCNEIQGYFFCRPVEAEEVRRWTSSFSLESYAIGQAGRQERQGSGSFETG